MTVTRVTAKRVNATWCTRLEFGWTVSAAYRHTIMTKAATRMIHFIGGTRSKLRPPRMAARAATAHNPITAPTPTESGSWYFAAKFAVTI
jgi:hypothetical protein